MTIDLESLETPVFDGKAAQRGYALNAMCFSFNDEGNRARFLESPETYFVLYGLDPEQREAVRARSITAMIRAGGNTYYLLKLANLLGMDVQDVGAQQTGVSREVFKLQLQAAGA
jgi:protocatechuate 4,5-dioxygenase alpha chain